MEFRNLTPFPACAYEGLLPSGQECHVVTLRRTMNFAEFGVLDYAREQRPLVTSDEYFAELNHSSVREESDYIPGKPLCDLIVVANAYAPRQKAAPSFDVRFRLYAAPVVRRGISADDTDVFVAPRLIHEKKLRITGPRFWVRDPVLARWRLTEPEPITELPIRYEFALGGEAQEVLLDSSSASPRWECHSSNPLGRGWLPAWGWKSAKRVPAAQIESVGSPSADLGQEGIPEGFGVIGRGWSPRRELAGTFDEDFIESGRPLPADFRMEYWNGAHPEMQVPYLVGDEIVELRNCTPSGRARFQLPGDRPYVLVRARDGSVAPASMDTDTLHVDVLTRRVTLISRLILPKEPPIRVLEARLITREAWESEAPRSPSLVDTEVTTPIGRPRTSGSGRGARRG